MINKTRLVRLTQKLIQINSENPPGNEWEAANFIKKEMVALGLSVKAPTFAKRRPNILATLKGTAPRKIAAKEAIILSPHIDTVPAGKGWKHKPFGGKIINGKIYGRGATDDKGNLACCMEVMCSLVEDGVKLKKDVIFAATVDEETGSRYGIIPLIERNILKAKCAFILDSDEFDTIIAQKGLIHGRVKIFGKKAHGAYNWRGVNAIEVGAKIIDRLKKHKFPYQRHPLMRGPTLNIGTIQGGDKVNMVADYCEFSFDMRYLPGMNPKNIIRQIKNIIKKEIKRFKIEIDNIQDPYEISPHDPMVTTFVNAAKRMGKKAMLKGSEGATVITFFKKKNIPAIATGFGSHGNAHTNDEFARIDILYHGARALEQFLKEFDSL